MQMNTTRWVSRRLFQLPQLMVQSGKALISQNPGLFRKRRTTDKQHQYRFLESRVARFPALLQAPKAPRDYLHNIVV